MLTPEYANVQMICVSKRHDIYPSFMTKGAQAASLLNADEDMELDAELDTNLHAELSSELAEFADFDGEGVALCARELVRAPPEGWCRWLQRVERGLRGCSSPALKFGTPWTKVGWSPYSCGVKRCYAVAPKSV